MNSPYLEVTYRNGKALAAYLYLARGPADRASRTEKITDELLVDYSDDGRPIEIEIVAPHRVTPAQINAVLSELEQPTITPDDLRPLAA